MAETIETARQPGNRSHVWPYLTLPALYLMLVASGPLYTWYADVAHGNQPDANIGYGLGFMWAALWGLPWSIWPWTYFSEASLSQPTHPPNNDIAEMTAYLGCGLLNVCLLVVGMLLLRRYIARTATERSPRPRRGQMPSV